MSEKPESVTKAIIVRMFYLDILTASERDLDQPISIQKHRKTARERKRNRKRKEWKTKKKPIFNQLLYGLYCA